MTISGLVLVACCIIVAIWDLIAVRVFKIPGSVSWFIRQQAILHPTLVLALGVLIGHFFAAMVPQSQ